MYIINSNGPKTDHCGTPSNIITRMEYKVKWAYFDPLFGLSTYITKTK
jgi:hypothetical protein